MNKKFAALGTAAVSLVIAVGAGVGVAAADERGGNCNNYGDNSVFFAPFCGANFGTAPSTPPQTLPPVLGEPPVVVPLDPFTPTLSPFRP